MDTKAGVHNLSMKIHFHSSVSIYLLSCLTTRQVLAIYAMDPKHYKASSAVLGVVLGSPV